MLKCSFFNKIVDMNDNKRYYLVNQEMIVIEMEKTRKGIKGRNNG